MDDAFDLLGLPRQPWLDPATVRAAFQQRSRAAHPDASGGDADTFAALNAAQRELSVPASRLRLLAGDTPIPAAPPDFELGFRVAALAREIDAVLTRHRAATNPLSHALLAKELSAVSRQLTDLQAALAERFAQAEAALRETDATDRSRLAAFAGEFTYLDRWHAQLRERRLELEIEMGNDGALPSTPGGKRFAFGDVRKAPIVVSHLSQPTPEIGRKHPAHHPTIEVFNRTNAIFLTCCAKDRRPLLARSEIHALLRDVWFTADAWRVGHYILMPDHLHLLCVPSGPDALPLGRWVKYWKSLASRDWPHPAEQPVWQNDFWDTQLRHGEHYAAKAEYLRNNPVRAGLCAMSEDWPHQGHIYEIPWHD